MKLFGNIDQQIRAKRNQNYIEIENKYIYGASVAQWLEHAGVSGSSPVRGGNKTLCGRREPSDYVSFRRAVKRQ